MIAERAKKFIRDHYADPDNTSTRKLFDWAAKQGFPKESTVDQIERGAKLDRAYVIYAMKELGQLGFRPICRGPAWQRLTNGLESAARRFGTVCSRRNCRI